MKICFITSHAYPGNTSTAYFEYSQELARQGHDVYVICARVDSSLPGSVHSQSRDGVEVHSISLRSFSKKSLEPTRFALKALTLLKRISLNDSIDILQMRSFPNLGLAITPFGSRYARATILDVRSTAISSPSLNFLSRSVLRLQRRLFSHVTVLDPALAQSIFGKHASEVTILPLGANMTRFEPGRDQKQRVELGYSDDAVVFVYVGSLETSRRIETILKAFSMIVQDYPQARLLIAGVGENSEKLERFTQEQGLAKYITFTGAVPFLDVPQYVRASDVGLAYVPDTVEYRNQPPLKTVEYLACGLPVIATDTPGNRRFVVDGVNGILINDQDDDLACAISTLLAQKTLRSELALQARDSVEKYSYKHIVHEIMLPYYENCLENEVSMTN